MSSADPPPASVGDAAEQRWRRIGIVVVAAIFGGIGLWAAFAPLSSAAIGTGVISVEMYRKTVQHLEGGIVREIKGKRSINRAHCGRIEGPVGLLRWLYWESSNTIFQGSKAS